MSLPLPVFDAPLSAAKLSPPRTRSSSVSPLGESEGGLFGNHYGKPVSVRVLPLVPFDTICGGAIGASGKTMCIKPLGECNTQSHVGNKAAISVLGGADQPTMGKGLFIDDRINETVFCTNIIPVERLPQDPAFYLTEQRTPTAWGEFFRTLVKRRYVSSAEESTIKEMVSSHDKLMESPFKKARTTDITDVLDVGAQLDKDNDTDLKIAHLANLIGSTGESESPESIFGQLERLSKTVDKVALTTTQKIALSKLKMLFLTQGDKLEILQENLKKDAHEALAAQWVPILKPMMDWFAAWTPRNADGSLGPIAGELETKLAGLESKLSSMQNQIPVNSGLNFTQGFRSFPSPSTVIQSNVEDRIKALQAQMDVMQEQLSGQQVAIGGQTFRSKMELGAWMKSNLMDEELFICMADASALLNMAWPAGLDSKDVMAFKSDNRKAGYGDGYVGKAIISFSFPLPTMFGKENTRSGARDTRILPGLKTAEEWDSGSSFTGAKNEADRQIAEINVVLQESIASPSLTPEAKLVAQECLTKTKLFLSALFAWMSRTYRNGVANKRCGEPLWKYISHCVRAIFNSLHQARASGRKAKADTVDMTWGFLQAIKLSEEFLNADFEGHPILSHVLNIHLQDRAVMNDKFDEKIKELEDSMKKFHEKTHKLDQAVSRALSKASSK